MATIKMYTDIPQSKKLAEILPLESADMYYEKRCDLPEVIVGNYSLHMQCRATDKDYKKLTYPVLSPCWSLAALLDVLPYKESLILAINDFQGDRKEKYVIGSVEHDKYDCYADNPIDACVEMILKLHELNLL